MAPIFVSIFFGLMALCAAHGLFANLKIRRAGASVVFLVMFVAMVWLTALPFILE